MVADGTLLFVAELRRLIYLTGGKVDLDCIMPANPKIAQVLKQIRVLDLLGVSSSIVPEDDDVVTWRYAHGTQVEGAKYEDVLQSYDGEIAEPLQQKLYAGITEAMTNVVHHAYYLDRADGLPVCDQQEWWMFSQEKDRYLTVAFCDLGAGIPRTLPERQKALWERMKRLGRTSDAHAIAEASRTNVSRLERSNRGYGLRQIVHVVTEVGGDVIIHSNRGTYMRNANGRRALTDHAESILGTLIFWRIPLQRGAHQ